MAEMRIKQWTKNLLTYAALIFNGSAFNLKKFLITSSAFIAFCLVSSGIYIINDIFDLEKDRLNPEKRNRPIASGAVNKNFALIFSFTILTLALIIAVNINSEFLLILLSYLLINILYTIWLKNVVIIDVMIIAYGFVARAVAGAVSAGINITEWFLLCVMFLSLFLALGKRRHELVEIQRKNPNGAREVLKHYKLELIDQMINAVTSAVIISYSLFAESNHDMMLTIPLVIYGIFYYLYVIHVKHSGGSPDEALYKEKPILITVLLYGISIIIIRNF